MPTSNANRNYPLWTPKLYQRKIEERFTQNIALGDTSPSALRKIGFKSIKQFELEEKKICEALLQVAIDPNMKAVWNWFEKNEQQIIYVHSIYHLIPELFFKWRLSAQHTNSDKKKLFAGIANKSKRLADDIAKIEFDRNTPLNEMNVYLMHHPWIDVHPINRENIHAIDWSGKSRLGSLLATAQHMPTLTTLLQNIETAAKQAIDEIERLKAQPKSKTNVGDPFRNFASRFLDEKLKSQFDGFKTGLVANIVTAITGTSTLDSSTVRKLARKNIEKNTDDS